MFEVYWEVLLLGGGGILGGGRISGVVLVE